MKNIIKSIEEEQIRIYEKSISSVCYISTEYSNVGLKRGVLSKGCGTGFIWDKKGHIITNFHVINNVDKTVVTITDKNNNKTSYVAKLKGIDPDTDLAILKIDAPESDLEVIRYNANAKPRIGQFAFIIGNPFGQDHTFTTGIVSAMNREITAMTGKKIRDVIQIDAAINPGNSGGTLLNSNGEIVGIITAVLGYGIYSGIGFAISISSVVKTINDIIETGYIPKAILGISCIERTTSIFESVKSDIMITNGVVIFDVNVYSSAYAMGLRGFTIDKITNKVVSIGDIIIAINDTPVNNTDELNVILKQYKPNDKIKLTYLRNHIEYTTMLNLDSYKGEIFTFLEN